MSRIDSLIQGIQDLQYSADTKTFDKGMFGSVRFHNTLPYRRDDNNIFFPATIGFILLKHMHLLDTVQSDKVHAIISGIRDNYGPFLSISDPYSYNFYKTQPNQHYPNGYFLSKIDHFGLADDADDTVIMTMSLEDVSKERIDTIRQSLVQFANLTNKKIKGYAAEYADLPFYGTWFGSGRMPIELEFCVLCNILCFTFRYDLELNDQDHASLELINRAIRNRDIINRRFQISGMYPRTPVVLYHITRLYTVMKEPSLYFDREDLISISKEVYSVTTSILERVICAIALLRLGVSPEYVDWDLNDATFQKECETFPFFTAPMLSGTSNGLLNYLKQFDFFKIHFRCKAFYYTLLLEYELLRKESANLLS